MNSPELCLQLLDQRFVAVCCSWSGGGEEVQISDLCVETSLKSKGLVGRTCAFDMKALDELIAPHGIGGHLTVEHDHSTFLDILDVVV